ncbi:MAG: hypothetical protein H6742_12805 [Alphaproteobacteria bacterium]|nr:hypothetical protein [Alphaproteobacteria bacterium]
MRSLALLPVLLLACTPEYGLDKDPPAPAAAADGQIEGRVCSADGRTWQQDALVYTNILNDDGRVVETRQVYTDPDGRYVLDELPGEQAYDVYVQVGGLHLDDQEHGGLWLEGGGLLILDEPDCFDPLQIDVAIVQGAYDDFEAVLRAMGFANYDVIDGLDEAELTSFLTSDLSRYDVVFFNGGHLEEGIIYPAADGTGEDVALAVADNIAAYVEAGGMLYASDWSYDVVEQVFPARLDFVGDDDVPDAAQTGEYDLINAAVSDVALSEYLDRLHVEVEFDLPVWPPVIAVDDGVSVHISGDVRWRQGTVVQTLPSAPLLVSFSQGEGRVIYSSFRVARNASADLQSSLQYLLYTL